MFTGGFRQFYLNKRDTTPDPSLETIMLVKDWEVPVVFQFVPTQSQILRNCKEKDAFQYRDW